MNLFKIFGLGAFYRARRLSKAIKNWRKFGVILFGSLFLASTFGSSFALAASSIEAVISPTSSEITLGSTKQFAAQIHSGTLNVTDISNISWTASKGSANVATGSGATFNFTPTTSGNFVIRASALYKGMPATLREPATLVVKDNGDTTPFSITIAPANSSIAVGSTQAYTPVAKYGNNTVTSASNITWVVKQNGGTVKTGTGQTFSYKPLMAGSYTVMANASYTVNGGLKTASSNTAILTATGGGSDGNPNIEVVISPTSAEITLGATKTYTAQVHSGTLNVTSSNQTAISWTASQNGNPVASGTGINLNLSPSTTGTFIIRASATYQGRPGVLREPATLLVKNGGQPPVETCTIQITNGGNGNITLGQASPLYTAKVVSTAGDITNQSNIDWLVRRSGDASIAFTGSGKTFGFTPTQTGVYTIQAHTQCGNHDAIASVTLTVNPAQPRVCTVFNINPRIVTLPLVNGIATQQFDLIAEDSVGNTNVNLSGLTWTSSGVGSVSPIVGGIANHALYSSTSAGTATVTIRGLCNGANFSDTAQITVVNTPNRIISRVVITPDNPTVLSGTSQQYRAIAFDTSDAVIDPSLVSFTWNLIGTGSSLGYLVNSNGEYVVFQSNPNLSGSYFDFIQVTATYLGVPVTDKAAITLYETTIQQYLNYVTMQPDRNPIYTNDSTPVRAQAYDNFGVAIAGCTYNWVQIGGAGSINSATNQQVITFASQSLIGAGNLQVTATCLGSSVSTTGNVQIISTPSSLRVELTPDPAYATTNMDLYFTARAYDNNVDVTNSTVFNWAMLNSNAGFVSSTNGSTAIVRTGSLTGTFGSAVQVTGTYNAMIGSDTSTIIIQTITPTYNLTDSLVGSLDGRGTATCSDDVITYVLTITNNNTLPITGLRVSMEVPTNTSFLSATSGIGSPTVSGRTINWYPGTLNIGQTASMIVRVTPVSGLTGTRTINASAYFTFDQKPSGLTINANPVSLVCNGTAPDGKGPLPSTGVEWQMIVALMAGALGLTTITYALARRKGMNQN